MLEAYRGVVRQLEEKRATELQPEKRLQEKRAEEAVAAATDLTPDGVERALGSRKADIGQNLAQVAERNVAEVARFKAAQKAVEAKEQELRELYDIDKGAASLAALIEAQNQKRRAFEAELGAQEEDVAGEIETTRGAGEGEEESRTRGARAGRDGEDGPRAREGGVPTFSGASSKRCGTS